MGILGARSQEFSSGYACEEQERRQTKEIGGWIMEPPRKQYVTLLTT